MSGVRAKFSQLTHNRVRARAELIPRLMKCLLFNRRLKTKSVRTIYIRHLIFYHAWVEPYFDPKRGSVSIFENPILVYPPF